MKSLMKDAYAIILALAVFCMAADAYAGYWAYLSVERVPGDEPMGEGTPEADEWLSCHWYDRPRSLVKKVITQNDREVQYLQERRCQRLDEIRRIACIVVAEYLKRGLSMEKVISVCYEEKRLVSSKSWRLLKEGARNKRDAAGRDLDSMLDGLSKQVESLFADVVQDVKRGYAAWAAANPVSAQTLANKRKMEELEWLVMQADARAQEAERRAANSAAAAAAAMSRANISGTW